ncbi:EAL domain-containing protein [Inquilinus sp. CAU 1745]|uniref:EAL domain-containing protein n=1 Tax=Inquilinus sp. CAU 1745 TaxID=3140369 RepID=UPI00325BEF8A
MSRRTAIVIALVTGLAAIALPIMVALHLAREGSVEEEMARVALLAGEVLQRSDRISDQMGTAFIRLRATEAATPCSAENIALMRQIDMISSLLQAVGYVDADRLVCSSLGRHGERFPIGPPDHVDATGIAMRASVELSITPGVAFTIAADAASGYAAIVHRDAPLDVPLRRPDVSLGVVTASTGEPILGRGEFRPEWIEALGDAHDTVFFDGRHVVAVARSRFYDHAAYVAAPAAYLTESARALAMVLAPVGGIAGLLLAFAVFALARQQLSLPAMLRSGLRRNEFFVHYQPIVELETARWVGAEALVRWRRDGETVRPDLFIPEAEEAGLIRRVTQRVMELVAGEAAGLLRRNPHFHIGINLSSEDLQAPDMVDNLRDTLRDAGIAPASLLLEATERGFLKADSSRQIVRDLRALGVSVAIDDFGTGYSSLSYLTTFELDYLKIDKSFVDTIGQEAATSQVIVHIIAMARALGLAMIAEGVETEAQARFLKENGVQYAQGWFYARPMPFAELTRLLEESEG